MEKKKKILIGVTGASGMLFLQSFLEMIQQLDSVEVHGVCSEAGKQVVKLELGCAVRELQGVSVWFDCSDFSAPPSSGSSEYEAMVILPCTMGTLGAVAGGLSSNLIHRAADVILKEKKKLILAVRETPFNRTHLSNMLKVHDAGGIICPPMPSFYLNPETLAEAAMTYCWRLADQLGLQIEDRKRWN